LQPKAIVDAVNIFLLKELSDVEKVKIRRLVRGWQKEKNIFLNGQRTPGQ
jgi:hypothetical protein